MELCVGARRSALAILGSVSALKAMNHDACAAKVKLHAQFTHNLTRYLDQKRDKNSDRVTQQEVC